MSSRVRRALVGITAAVIAFLGLGQPASAHGFSSVVYVHITGGDGGRIRTVLELEYDLFVVSAADAEHDDPLFRAGTAAFEAEDARAQAAALESHADSAVTYVTGRFSVAAGGKACTPSRAGDITMGRREGVPYASLPLEWACPAEGGDREVRSTLFPDSEGYVRGTRTIATYDLTGLSGSAALDAGHPSFSISQSWYERFWEFFRLGAEHLLTGVDHILFLLALIAGSRRLREIVLAATSFTLAHSVTFLLAALGLVEAPERIVEPVIALSIAVVAGWHLLRLRRHDDVAALAGPAEQGPLGLDRAGWLRLGVVFCFGLVHGLGFAGALGIDEPWSWTLLWSLLVFNVGIEAVQLGIIVIVFPLLALLRHRAPRAGMWATGALCAGVAVMGSVWFVQRVLEG
ncbi:MULTISPECIES: HupE/UreJ family protein [unclassified Streptomyces]|uniref:HupE/UreJ family protein n=1 Tax=unclassified Streptomyces TaxID=2593676 RepID=UPI00365BFC2E